MARHFRIPAPGTQAFREYRSALHAAAAPPRVQPRAEPPSPKLPDHPISKIITEVAVRHAVPIYDIVSRSRRKRVVHARYEVMWRARHETKMSLLDIADRIGGWDHTTVLHGVRQHQRLLDEARGIPTVSPHAHRSRQIEVLTQELVATRRERDAALEALSIRQETRHD